MAAHGTYSAYSNDGCRCAECIEVGRAFKREYIARRRQDPEYRAREKRKRQQNPEPSRRATRNYLAKNPDHVKNWRAKNRERARAQVLAYRASVREADHGCVTVEFLTQIYEMPCAYCGKPSEHADHAYPLSRGGAHCVANIQPACAKCNTSKSARILEELPRPIRECEVIA